MQEGPETAATALRMGDAAEPGASSTVLSLIIARSWLGHGSWRAGVLSAISHAAVRCSWGAGIKLIDRQVPGHHGPVHPVQLEAGCCHPPVHALEHHTVDGQPVFLFHTVNGWTNIALDSTMENPKLVGCTCTSRIHVIRFGRNASPARRSAPVIVL